MQVEGERKKAEKSKKREITEYVIVLLAGISLALFVRFNVGQLIMVNGPSMLPTFQHGDFAVTSKHAYKNEKPKVGDVVVVKADALDGKKIIKRVVGVEGDTIEVTDGYLYRNGEKIEEDYIKEKILGDAEKITVPKNHVFIMGDNRNNSADSRVIGPVPEEKILGKVVLELWNNPFKKY